MTQYTRDYHYMGKDYAIDVPGETEEEALAHIRAAYFNGTTSELVFRAEAPNWLERIFNG